MIPGSADSRAIDALVRERAKGRRALYTLDFAALEALCPTLIVTQALCDVCAVAESEVNDAACRLSKAPRVINLEPTRFDDVMECLRMVGEAAGVAARAETLVADLRGRAATVAKRAARVGRQPRVVLLEWIDPLFSCGHWSPELVELTGGVEMIGRAGERSRRVEWGEIVRADPEVMLIACCGFDVRRTDEDLPTLRGLPGYAGLSCVRNDQVFVTDGGAYFSRPGPRLVDSLEILSHAIDPRVHPLPEGLPAAIRV